MVYLVCRCDGCVLIIHSFIHSGDLYSASSRDYYSEAQLMVDVARCKGLCVFYHCLMIPCASGGVVVRGYKWGREVT